MIDIFNNLKRSTAFVQLARMRALSLLTDEEFAGFSTQTQTVLALFLNTSNAEPGTAPNGTP